MEIINVISDKEPTRKQKKTKTSRRYAQKEREKKTKLKVLLCTYGVTGYVRVLKKEFVPPLCVFRLPPQEPKRNNYNRLAILAVI